MGFLLFLQHIEVYQNTCNYTLPPHKFLKELLPWCTCCLPKVPKKNKYHCVFRMLVSNGTISIGCGEVPTLLLVLVAVYLSLQGLVSAKWVVGSLIYLLYNQKITYNLLIKKSKKCLILLFIGIASFSTFIFPFAAFILTCWWDLLSQMDSLGVGSRGDVCVCERETELKWGNLKCQF